MRAGPNLVGVRAPVRTLYGGRYPLMRYGQPLAGVRYDVEAFASIVPASPSPCVRVVLRNTTARPVQARWAIGIRSSGGALKPSGVRRFRFPRPAVPQLPGLYTQPGWTFDPAADLHVRRSRDPPRRPRHGDVPAPRARHELELQAREGRARCCPTTVFGLAEYRVALGPRGTAGWTSSCRRSRSPTARRPRWRCGWRPFAAHRDALLRAGRRRSRGRWRSSSPSAGSRRRTTRASSTSCLPRYQLPAGDWVQPVNKLRYHAFWLRDASVIAQALDLAGLPARRARTSASSIAGSTPDGQFISRAGPARRPRPGDVGDRRARAAAPATASSRARRCSRSGARSPGARALAADPLGLVPPSDPRDNELVAGHLAGDDFWAVAGLEAAVGVARMLGEDERARLERRAHRPDAARRAERVAFAAARNGRRDPARARPPRAGATGEPAGRPGRPVLDPFSTDRHAHAGPRPRALPRGPRDLRRVPQPPPLPLAMPTRPPRSRCW